MNKINLTHSITALLLVCLLALPGCEMEELQKSKASKEAVFGSEKGLELYTNSFYDLLPGNETGVFTKDETSDLVAITSVSSLLTPNALNPSTSSGWDWGALRNINYFIQNAEKSDIKGKERFLGIAHFFRAYFYFEKVKRFGDVPLISEPIATHDSTTLFGTRDSRFDVMESVLSDLDYAIEHLAQASDQTRTKITRDVALAYKTRICLYEASFRKYHTEYNMQHTADKWYREVIKAADMISGYSLVEGPNAYRELFMAERPNPEEVIHAVVMNQGLQIYNARNRKTISPTYGNRPALNRDFIKMYLNADGSSYMTRDHAIQLPLEEELSGRDPRLTQTIRPIDYMRTSNGTPVVSPPNFGECYTGYQIIKGLYDEIHPYDDETRNLNAHLLFRYAEVLLNKAEALAELAQMTDIEWTKTIGALRARAGIVGESLTHLPTEADPYLLQYYKGRFNDPVLLEIVRERAVEMILEGLRYDDLIRWRLGELLEQPMKGIYVDALGAQDFNGDGINDVVFYAEGSTPTVDATSKIEISMNGAGNGKYHLTNGTQGELVWTPGPRQWEDKKYLYPIPESDLLDNKNLGQNPGW